MTFVDPCIIVQFIKKNPTRCNSVPKFFKIIPYLYDAQHVSGDTPPIIRSLKLHWQPMDVVRQVPDNVHKLHVQTTFDVCKTSGSQCSFRLLMMGGVSPETF